MRILRRKLRRDLFRQKAQYLAVAVTVVLGVSLFAASFDAFRNLEVSYRRTYERLAFADLIVSGGDTSGFARTAAATPGVAAVATRGVADVPFLVAGDHKLLGRVVGLPVEGQPPVDRVDVEEGEYLDPSDPTGVLAERHLADHFDLGPGDDLRVLGSDGSWRSVTVRGVVVSPEYLWPARSRQDVLTTPDDFGVLFVAEALAEELGGSRAVPQVLVRYEDGADGGRLDEVLEARAREVGADDVLTAEQQPSNAALREDVSGFGQMSLLFPLLFLTAAAMATYVLLTRTVWAQRAQIGTLRANGLGRGAVLRHFLAYGIVVGGAGATVGAVLGVLLGRLVTGVYTDAVQVPDTVVRFRPLTPVAGLLFGLGAGLLAALVPARSAVRLTPADAMRGETPAGRGRRSLVERVVPPLGRLPVRWRMVLRDLGRSRRRSLSTVVGVVLSLVLVLASWGLIDTTTILLDRQFNQVQRQDAQLYLDRPLDPARLAAVASVEGVASAEPVSTLTASVRADGERYQTQLVTFEAGTSMHRFLDGDRTVSLPGGGVLAGSSLRSVLDVGEGDEVTVSFPALGASVPVVVRGFVDEPLGTFLYASRPSVEGLLAGSGAGAVLDAPGVGSVMVRYEPGVDGDVMRRRLGAEDDVVAFVDSRALYDTVQSVLSLFYAFVGVMLAFGSVMAFALVFNTMSVNIAERAVELAALRASGMGRGRRIARLLTGENVLLTLLGIVPGLLAGYGVASLMMSSYTSDLFRFDLQMRAGTLVLSALAVLLVALLSQWPGLRAVGRLEIARVVRERSQ